MLSTQQRETFNLSFGRLFEGVLTGRRFILALIVVSILPYAVYLLSFSLQSFSFPNVSIVSLGVILAVISGTHVFSTVYLLANKNELYGVDHIGIKIVVIPALLISLCFIAHFFFNVIQLAMFLGLYALYGIYHFGRQNLGVHAFSCQIMIQRPMSGIEKKTIIAGIFSGIVYQFVKGAPALAESFEVDIDAYQTILKMLSGLVAVSFIAITYYVQREIRVFRRNYNKQTIITYLIGVYFFLPTFSAELFAGAYSVAHGLQYLLFMIYHAVGRSQDILETNLDGSNRQNRSATVFAVMAPILFLAAVIGCAYLIWDVSAEIQAGTFSYLDFIGENESMVKGAMALVAGLTLAHFWIDQKIWRFSSSERRQWLFNHYRFLKTKATSQ